MEKKNKQIQVDEEVEKVDDEDENEKEDAADVEEKKIIIIRLEDGEEEDE